MALAAFKRYLSVLASSRFDEGEISVQNDLKFFLGQDLKQPLLFTFVFLCYLSLSVG